MKIELGLDEYRYVSENSSECDENCAFIKTKLNSRYENDAKEHGSKIISPKDIKHFFGLDKIKIIGITGTNGKTTTASAIYSMLLDLGYKVAFQGTRGFFMNDEVVEGKSLTTPTLLNSYIHIYQAVQASCDFFIMEVSSHAIVQERIEGMHFELKILTNITQDHLDYHKTLEEYIAVKNSFFQDDSKKLINRDESKAKYKISNAYSYGIENPATYKVMAYSMNDGLSGIISNFQDHVPFISELHGFFNLYNMTAAFAATHLLTGRKLEEIADVMPNFAGVSGRMEKVSTRPLVIVDFAHTPDGMYEILNSLKEKSISVVFGAGGDRDKDKRSKMGQVASTMAKKLYITSDNPRNEDPMDIINDILSGIKHQDNVKVNENRKDAIKLALDELEDDEIVLILGKGDETHQIIYDKKIPFDDREIVREILKID